MHIVGSDKYNERECPNCKKTVTPLFLKTAELKSARRTPTTAGTQDIYSYIFACPECKILFFDYRK